MKFPFPALPARLQQNQDTGSFAALEQQYRRAFSVIRAHDPLASALSFSALLLDPDLQSSGYRLQNLVHLAFCFGSGSQKLKQRDFRQLYAEMESGIVARQEDPAEDVFVSNISTKRGNFLVLEGLSEAAGYFLQIFMQLVDSLPDHESYDQVRDPVYAVLSLSNKVCERAGLVRHQLGSDSPQRKLSTAQAKKISKLRECLAFSDGELLELGLSVDDLSEFGFDPALRGKLAGQSTLNSSLQRYPLAHKDGETFLILPTAVSDAIRQFLFEKLTLAIGREQFVSSLAFEFSKRIFQLPIFGEQAGLPLEFISIGETLMASVFRWVDTGRALNIVFCMDHLIGFEKSGFGGWYKDSKNTGDAISAHMRLAKEKAEKDPNFKSGMSILVGCGIGRGMSHDFSLKGLDDWEVDSLSVHDFETLSNLNGFAPISLWRLKEAEKLLATSGVELFNINGLLNLIAWRDNLDGHMVPHAQVPDGFLDGGRALIQVQQNALRDLRHKVQLQCDFHSSLCADGSWSIVRRISSSLSEFDRSIPLYAKEFDANSLPAIVYEGEQANWWIDLVVGPEKVGMAEFERWKMLTTWLPRIASSLEAGLPTGTIPAVLTIKAEFVAAVGGLQEQPAKMSDHEVRQLISINVEHEAQTVMVGSAKEFENAFFNKDNVAEKEWVRATVGGLLELFGVGEDAELLEKLLLEIVPNSKIRQTHAFPATSFRDFIRPTLPARPTFIDKEDATNLKLFLGWQVRERTMPSELQGTRECTDYLRKLVTHLEDKLINFLSQFSRQSALEKIIINHEAAICDQETWKRTSAAVSSLHDGKEEAIHEILDHQFKLNGVFQSSRNLVELANCACAEVGGQEMGAFDLSRAMAMMIEIIEFGGWSDAIYFDAMEPRLKITPLGDVFANHDFFDDVVMPFGKDGMQVKVQQAIDGYETHFNDVEGSSGNPKTRNDQVRSDQFAAAWLAETGVPIEAFVEFCVTCEEVGLEDKKPIGFILRSKLKERIVSLRPNLGAHIDQVFEQFSLVPRESWKDIPAGFQDSDRQPWKFRRLLSVLRMPLIQINTAHDPMICLWPGMVGDAGEYMIATYHNAEFRESQLRSKDMNRWNGFVKDLKTGFNDQVAKELVRLGWTAKSDVNVTQILGKGNDPKFGDIKRFGDVDVLAWSADGDHVLVLECKDLMYRKTPGEIAEQLSKFRGMADAKGKPDLLLKHLNRIDILNAHLADLAIFTGITNPIIQGHLIFSGQVPMGYAKHGIMEKSSMIVFEQLKDTLSLL